MSECMSNLERFCNLFKIYNGYRYEEDEYIKMTLRSQDEYIDKLKSPEAKK